mgnify:CR=1 FL=1
MSSDQMNYELVEQHLNKVELRSGDLAILAVRPTSDDIWFQVAVAQNIPNLRVNQEEEPATEKRKRLTLGRGDDRWSTSKAVRAWQSMTMEDIEAYFADYPSVINAAKACATEGKYVPVTGEDGEKPLMNPVFVDEHGERYPFAIEVSESHRPSSKWDIEHFEDVAKQTGEEDGSRYLYVKQIDESTKKPVFKAIFRQKELIIGEAEHTLIAHDGATSSPGYLTHDPIQSTSLKEIDEADLKPDADELGGKSQQQGTPLTDQPDEVTEYANAQKQQQG